MGQQTCPDARQDYPVCVRTSGGLLTSLTMVYVVFSSVYTRSSWFRRRDPKRAKTTRVSYFTVSKPVKCDTVWEVIWRWRMRRFDWTCTFLYCYHRSQPFDEVTESAKKGKTFMKQNNFSEPASTKRIRQDLSAFWVANRLEARTHRSWWLRISTLWGEGGGGLSLRLYTT
jgi:hypothetical protein